MQIIFGRIQNIQNYRLKNILEKYFNKIFLIERNEKDLLEYANMNKYKAEFNLDKAKFSRKDGNIETEMELVISTEENFEIRKLVNEIVSEYGKPDEIKVELARNLKASKSGRNEERRRQQKLERELKKKLKKLDPTLPK